MFIWSSLLSVFQKKKDIEEHLLTGGIGCFRGQSARMMLFLYAIMQTVKIIINDSNDTELV